MSYALGYDARLNNGGEVGAAALYPLESTIY